MTNVNPVGWFDIYVSDLARAKQFYAAVFDVQFTDLPAAWGKQSFFPFNPQSPNISGALVEKPDHTPGAGHTMVYFETADCAATAQRVAAAGGRVLQPKMDIGEFGFVAICQDSEGNTIGLHSRN